MTLQPSPSRSRIRLSLTLMALWAAQAEGVSLQTISDFDYDFDNNGGVTYPLQQDFKGVEDVTFTFLESDPGGNENGNYTADFTGFGGQPSYLQQEIRFFEFTPHALTAAFAMDFAIPLEAGDLLLFLDFDLMEESASIRAFSPEGTEITDLSGWTYNEYPGQTGVSDNTHQWDPATAQLTTDDSTAGNVALPLATLTLDQPVGRLEYLFTYAEEGGMSFQVATLVPEPSTASLLAGCALLLLRRRR
ncbi:MAG: PEP-CTERM sorting domain-containing protein [Verrucomicrobiota bacterium JB023]|nr:PEP-CTERM sorting domain-containing protein [Verrucomicrobiota bacterium JB023]